MACWAVWSLSCHPLLSVHADMAFSQASLWPGPLYWLSNCFSASFSSHQSFFLISQCAIPPFTIWPQFFRCLAEHFPLLPYVPGTLGHLVFPEPIPASAFGPSYYFLYSLFLPSSFIYFKPVFQEAFPSVPCGLSPHSE